MRILILKLKHIGDGLMMTPTLCALRAEYPSAEIWVVVRKGCEGILVGCPAIDRIEVSSARPFSEERNRMNWWLDLQLALRLRRQRFDRLFELGDGDRGRWFALLCGAREAYSVKPAHPLAAVRRSMFDGVSTFAWEHRHRVEKDFYAVSEFMPLPGSPASLTFERAATQNWPAADGVGDFAVVHAGTRETNKRWPKDNWLEVCRALLDSVGHLVISAGPDPLEQAEAAWLADKFGRRVLNTAGRLNWAQVAGLLYRAKLFVGVDTAAMHLAAACGTPIVALFGPSREANWLPWRANYRIVTPPGVFEMEANGQSVYRPIVQIRSADVIAACEAMLKTFPQGARDVADECGRPDAPSAAV